MKLELVLVQMKMGKFKTGLRLRNDMKERKFEKNKEKKKSGHGDTRVVR